MNRYALCAENLTVSAGTTVIAKSVSFRCGGVVGLFGRNGAWKTSLIRTLMHPKNGADRGKVSLIDEAGKRIVVSDMSPRERAKYISYVPQDSSMAGHMKVMDFLLTGRTPYLGIFESPKKTDYALAEKAAVTHGITHLLDKYTDEISGGERKLAYIARAQVQGASWMLLDEPAAGLDYGRQREFFKKLKESAESGGIGAVVTLHDPHLAEQFCDEILVLHNGILYKSSCIWDDVEAIYGIR
jgi:iron complex transport system ATP-binding protein